MNPELQTLRLESKPNAATPRPIPAPSWYCVHTQSKREHIAAHWLDKQLAIESCLPRIRFRRRERHRLVWVTEALFPTYLFARFDLWTWLAQVEAVPGVIELVRFGAHWPAIPASVIDALRANAPGDLVHVIDQGPAPGQAIEVVAGPFQGFEGVVTRVLPAGQRIQVLLELLGRQTAVEVAATAVTTPGEVRHRLFATGT